MEGVSKLLLTSFPPIARDFNQYYSENLSKKREMILYLPQPVDIINQI
jgi:hypothetical protein